MTLFGLIKSKEERAADRRAATDRWNERLAERIEKYKVDIEESARKMESKDCPFQDGNCTRTCVHFSIG